MTRSTRRRTSWREVSVHLPPDVTDQAALVAARERVALPEPFGQANDANLEAPPRDEPVRRAERDLRAPAADVNDDGGALAEVDRVGRRQVNQAGLFGARDHADAQAHLLLHGGHEVAAVLGFADGTCGRRDDFVHAVRRGNLHEL